MSELTKVYSLNEELYVEELFELFEELDDDDNLEVGVEYWIGDKHEYKASSFFDHTDLLDQADERAYEEGGDYAENFTSSASQDAKDQLKDFVKAWADENISVNFWGVKNTKKCTITQADIDDFRS